MEWLKKRLSEKSTLVGLVTVIAAVYTGPYAGLVGSLASTIIAAAGGGLVAATTKKD